MKKKQVRNEFSTNLQRERISYSEKAFAYKMKNDAMKRTAGRPRSQIDHNLKGKRTVEIIAEETGESPKQVQRYITLKNLIPELLQQLDDELISFNPAVELAALKEKEQKQIIEANGFCKISGNGSNCRGLSVCVLRNSSAIG